MLIGRSVFPSPCGRSPRADEVMAFGRRTVTMSFSGLRPIFAIGGSARAAVVLLPVCGSVEPRGLCGAPVGGFAETICGSYEPRGPQPPHAEARNFAVASSAGAPQAAARRRNPEEQAPPQILPRGKM